MAVLAIVLAALPCTRTAGAQPPRADTLAAREIAVRALRA
jgi:hypothetical protein